ncbi:MAG: cation diffusion facilitator CzcD-associated flavoprotein CzcO [Saprospiraceae bacterium]|jgi:cation diffusion facilitator CzcD-associated flavoprotein CzcO
MVKSGNSFSVVIIGAGFSGICMAIKLLEKGITDFVILEKAPDLGGTWRENTYPGAECDVPSALYSFSFEPYPDWEYKWSHQPQILKYIKHCSSKYKVDQHLKFNQTVKTATWDEASANWLITNAEGETYQANSIVSAIGQLHYPSYPSFEGMDTYKGDSWHSAQWNHDVDLKGKRIGVIGNAASAIQFIPEIADKSSSLTVFQRTPNWMLPKQDRLYRNWEKALVRKIPFLLRLYRLKIWLLGGALFFLMKDGNRLLRKFYQWQSTNYIKDTISDTELAQKLVPNFPLGAKRVLFSDNYYAALNKEDVHLDTTPITKITSAGVDVSDRRSIALDVIIYATGFKTNPFFQHISVTGKNKSDLRDQWKEAPVAYLGMTVSNFPNFFMIYGPNTNLGHNSIIIMSEAQSSYIAQAIDTIQKQNLKSIEVTSEVMMSYHTEIQKRLKTMIWNTIEKSWYRSADGGNPNNWPGRTMEYMRRVRHFKLEKYKTT